MKIEGKVALVTGGASGLGEACVRDLVAKKAKVLFLDMNEERGAALSSELGDSTLFMKADVTSPEEIENVIAEMKSRLGGIHIAVNCAGIGWAQRVVSKHGPMQLDIFAKIIEVNLIGTFNVIRLAAQAMLENELDGDDGRGAIINTASAAAYEGQIGQSAYSASKGGIVSMTLPLARDLASKGIRVVSIAPGLFDTPMLAALPEEARAALSASVPFPSRLGFPSEFAALVSSIVENPMINGTTIRIDGAIRMAPK